MPEEPSAPPASRLSPLIPKRHRDIQTHNKRTESPREKADHISSIAREPRPLVSQAVSTPMVPRISMHVAGAWICPCGSCTTGDLNCLCSYRNNTGQVDAEGALLNWYLRQGSNEPVWKFIKKWSLQNKTSSLDTGDLTDLGLAIFSRMAKCWDMDHCCKNFETCPIEKNNTCPWKSLSGSDATCADESQTKFDEFLKSAGYPAGSTCAQGKDLGLCKDVRHHSEMARLCAKTCRGCNVMDAGAMDLLLDDAIVTADLQLASEPWESSRRSIDTNLQAGVKGWTLTPKTRRMTHTPTADASCFADADSFDCLCHDKFTRLCKIKTHRSNLDLGTGTISSLSDCYMFYVCTHSQTCDLYKKTHCKRQMDLLKKLQGAKHRVETC